MRVSFLPLVFFLSCQAVAQADALQTRVPQARALVPVERSADEMMIFEIVLERRLLAEGIFGYVTPAGVLLPLREILSAFELPITVDPGAGVAEGWFLAEARRFHLDLVRQEVTVEGRTTRFASERVELHFDDIYIEAGIFSEWFPITLGVDLASLRITARPSEKLPLQSRLERETRWNHAGRDGRGAPRAWEPRFPAHPTPYRALGWPLLDIDLGLGFARGQDGTITTDTRHAVLARGDLFGMTGELFLSDSASRLALLRRDPDAGMLGPLRASDIRIGDVGSVAEPLIGGGEMRGLEISSGGARKMGSSSVFDRTTLAGDVLPGWEVELYRNNVLEGFQSIGAEGRYLFPDIALHTGMNLLRLVFYGPHGERRERVERVFIRADLLPPGETRYRFGLYQQGMSLLTSSATASSKGLLEEPGVPRLGVDVERGLNRSLSLAAGVSSLGLADGRHTYARAALKTSLFGAGGRLRWVADTRGGWAVQAGVQRRFGRLSLGIEHLENDGLESPELHGGDGRGTLRSRSEARLETSFSLPRIGALSLRLEGRRTLRRTVSPPPDREELELRARTGFTVALRGWHLRPQQSFDWIEGHLNAPGELRAEGRAGRLRLRSALTWGLVPIARLTGLTLNGHVDLKGELRLSVALTRQLGGDTTSARLGIDWAFAPLRLRLDASGSTDGDARLGAAVSFGLGRAGRPDGGRQGGDRRWRMSKERRAQQGTVTARIFLDLDGDGRMSGDDPPLEGVRLEVNGRRQGAASDARGLVHIALASYRHSDLRIAEGSLENPFWVPAIEGRGFVGRPGISWTADFPVVLTGEIDGTVFLERDGKQREAANVRLELVGEDGEVTATCKSQFDGFYLFQRVRPGRYSVRVAAEQAVRLGLHAAPRPVRMAGGEVVTGIDLVANSPI